jgi:gas vesicle protein
VTSPTYDPTSGPVDPGVEQPDPRLDEALPDPRLGEAGPPGTFADSELEYPRTEWTGEGYDQPGTSESARAPPPTPPRPATDRTSSAKDAVADGAYAAKDAVADKAYATTDTVSERASDAREPVRQAPRRMKRRAQGYPLAAGVVAFGLGMLMSSLIPSSEKEREAASQLQENLEPVKEKATEVAGETGESLKPAAQEAAQSVKTTAQEGVQSVKQEGQSAAVDVKDQAQASTETVQQLSS